MHKEQVMVGSEPSFASRFFLAFVAFWRTLVDGDFAAGILRLRRKELPAPSEERAERAAVKAPVLRETTSDAALQLLAILQREGRLIDFLEEDIKSFSDADVGVAARVVHEGCRNALRAHFTVSAVREEAEGDRVTLREGFDASSVRLTGNVVGEAPFNGVLQHRGWRVTDVKLPKLTEGHDVRIVAPAEVEL